MKYIIIAVVFVTLFCSKAYSAEINVEWKQVVGADGYKLQTSEDFGATWTEIPNLTWTAFTLGNREMATATITVADNVLVLVRAAAYDSQSTAWRLEAGVFYNTSWKPIPAPPGLGVN